MLDLSRIITSIPDWLSKTPVEIREYLNESTTILKTSRQNANDLTILLGPKLANQLALALQEAGYILTVMSLASPQGIDFGHQVTQDTLTILGQNQVFAPYANTLKALGQDTRTRWARITDEIMPDVEDFATAKDLAIVNLSKNETITKIHEWLTIANTLSNAGIIWSEIEGKTIAELQLIEELL